MDVTSLPDNPAAISITFFRMKASGFASHPFERFAFKILAKEFYQKQQASLASVTNSNINAIAKNLFSSDFLPYRYSLDTNADSR